jgi:hypothetical protein
VSASTLYALASANVASAATTAIASVRTLNVSVTGTTTITSFGSARSGVVKLVTFTGALTLTHNATSLILPGTANIVTAAGDFLVTQSLGSGNWRVLLYARSNGGTVIQPASADQAALSGSLTNSTGATPDLTIADVSTAVTGVDGAGNNAASKADVDTRLTAINGNFSDLADRMADVETLLTAIRSGVVSAGVIKGSA